MPARQFAADTTEVDQHERLARAVLAMDLKRRDAWLSQLDPSDIALVESAIARITGRGARATPTTLAASLDPNWVQHPHLDLLGRQFRKACTGESKRQLWSLPSRYQKTTALGWGVTWGLDEHPDGRWAYVTYGDTLADEFGVAVRDRLAQYDELRVTLRRDMARKDRFLTTEGGGLLCRGVNSGIIGFGVNRRGGLLLDDPMKNWQEAHSKARREHLFTQFTGTLRHRLDDEDAPIIVCHARWHIQDITGELLARMADETGEEWEHVSIPALCTDPATDRLGRALGEPIAPDLFTRDQVLSRQRGMVSTYIVAAIEQQAPLKDEGKELLREWFHLALPGEVPSAPDRAISSWDLKLKDREAGDYVVGQCWWKVGSGFWCMDQIRGQYDHATTENAIALMAVRHPEITEHHLEAAASAPEVTAELRKALHGYEVSDQMAERLGMTTPEREAVQELRRGGIGNIRGVNVKGDKSVRTRTYTAPKAEHGHVHLPAESPWVGAWLDEHTAFPTAGVPDDQVDATSQALKILGGEPGGVSMPKRDTAPGPRRQGRTLQRPLPR